MRGTDEQTGSLFSDQSPESLVPSDHPLRVIRVVVNTALECLSGEFSQLYSPYGRASIAPEKLLRALLVQAFFGVRSERQLMEQVRYNMERSFSFEEASPLPLAEWCRRAGAVPHHQRAV